MDTLKEDREKILELGGASAVAEILGYPKAGGVQRVTNWMTRGIPATVKLAHPDIFLVMPGSPKRIA